VKLREDASTSWYWCEEICGAIHVGHTRMGEREKFRMFEDLAADLPDLLIKLRGQATRKQVAEVAGVRPIRLKELEEGLKHPEGLETLGKVLRVYRVRLSVAMCRGSGGWPDCRRGFGLLEHGRSLRYEVAVRAGGGRCCHHQVQAALPEK
jgi:hypothetical protein